MENKILLDFARRICLVLAVIFGLFGAGQVLGQEYSPTVTTDKLDYAPGEVAIISGSGWIGDTMIDIHMDEDPPLHEDHEHDFYNVAVDAAGNWSVQFQIEEYHLGVTFYVTVTGKETGRTAEHVFTDANSTLSSPTPSSAVYGSLVTISTTLTQQGGGHRSLYRRMCGQWQPYFKQVYNI